MPIKYFRLQIVIAAFVFVVMFAIQVPGQSPNAERAESAKYIEAEKFILKSLRAGDIARLEEEFKDNEDKRVIRASFLEALLVNPGKMGLHRNGVAISGTRIVGTLDLTNAEIDTLVFLERCEFDDVYFFQTVFKKGLHLNGSSFHGRVIFRNATVTPTLSAVGSKFTKETETANFTHLKVGGLVSFDGGIFAAPVNFVYAEIDGPFIINNAQFLCKETAGMPCRDTEVIFNSMRANGGFLAQGAVFERAVNLVNVKAAYNFQGDKVTFKKSANFQATTVGLSLSLSGAKFFEGADFKGVNIPANLDLNDAQFHWDQPADFRHAKAYSLTLQNTWFRRPPNFGRLTYQNIYPTTGLLNLIKTSNSDYSAYTELEQFLQRRGFASEADEVFMERKKYERRQGLTWFDSMKSYLSQALQGFGRRPHRVLYYDFGVLLIGAFLFRRRKMELKSQVANEGEAKSTSAENSPPYNSLLYSLTLFAPTIDTQYTNNWEPKREHRKTRRYIYAHRVLGYILVPLTIAIWTGIFR